MIFAVHDPLVVGIPRYLHPEIEMSQLSKQVQLCPLWLFVHPLCVQTDVVRFSICSSVKLPFGQRSCQLRFRHCHGT